jgi:hypothetical protein
VTALAGQVLTIDGMPLARVTLQIGSKRALTDGSGRFLMPGLPTGKSVLLIDGTSASHGGATFGIFQVGVYIVPRITNVLPFTIWMPVLDMAHAVTIPSPTTQETVISNPLMPGLELHIPAGTTITDINGKIVHTISITAVPLDRPPVPLPIGVEVPIYFTIQPGGSELWTTSGKWAWGQLYYPNPEHLAPGTRFDFWNYDPPGSGRYVYGHGSVSKDGSQVIPDPGVGIWSFTGAMVGGRRDWRRPARILLLRARRHPMPTRRGRSRKRRRHRPIAVRDQAMRAIRSTAAPVSFWIRTPTSGCGT